MQQAKRHTGHSDGHSTPQPRCPGTVGSPHPEGWPRRSWGAVEWKGEAKKGTIQPYSLSRWSSSWQKDGVLRKTGLQVKVLFLFFFLERL